MVRILWRWLSRISDFGEFLAVSRSFGDKHLKCPLPLIISTPEIEVKFCINNTQILIILWREQNIVLISRSPWLFALLELGVKTKRDAGHRQYCPVSMYTFYYDSPQTYKHNRTHTYMHVQTLHVHVCVNVCMCVWPKTKLYCMTFFLGEGRDRGRLSSGHGVRRRLGCPEWPGGNRSKFSEFLKSPGILKS